MEDVNAAVIDQLREKWSEIGLSTTPINFDRSKQLIDKIYENAGYEPPEFYFRASSPLIASMMTTALQDLGYETVVASSDPQKLLDNEVQKMKRDGTKNVSIVSSEICFGNHEAPVLAFYDYFINEKGYEKNNVKEEIAPFMELAEVSGWWIPMRRAAIIVDRPTEFKFDEDNRLHCATGPAVSYPDPEFKVYAWHGVQIPGDWIEKKGFLTPEMALSEVNMERRRAACEILGWDNILNELDAKVIDVDEPKIGTLVEVEIPEIGTERFLRVLCGTGRQFAIPVPPEMTTALEANSWSFGVAANEYIPEIRT